GVLRTIKMYAREERRENALRQPMGLRISGHWWSIGWPGGLWSFGHAQSGDASYAKVEGSKKDADEDPLASLRRCEPPPFPPVIRSPPLRSTAKRDLRKNSHTETECDNQLPWSWPVSTLAEVLKHEVLRCWWGWPDSNCALSPGQ